MPVYTPTVFVQGSAPGMSATEMNKMGNAIATCVQIDGSTPMTGALEIDRTLGGSDQAFLTLKATDGKTYSFFVIASDGSVELEDVTDGKAMARWYPDGVSRSLVYDNGTATIRLVREFIGTTDPATYTTVNEGDRWRKV